MVPLIPDVFPSNEGIYVCVCPECHFFPLGNGSETIYHCEHVDGNRRFQMGFAKQDFFIDSVSENRLKKNTGISFIEIHQQLHTVAR